MTRCLALKLKLKVINRIIWRMIIRSEWCYNKAQQAALHPNKAMLRIIMRFLHTRFGVCFQSAPSLSCLISLQLDHRLRQIICTKYSMLYYCASCAGSFLSQNWSFESPYYSVQGDFHLAFKLYSVFCALWEDHNGSFCHHSTITTECFFVFLTHCVCICFPPLQPSGSMSVSRITSDRLCLTHCVCIFFALSFPLFQPSGLMSLPLKQAGECGCH